MCKKIRTRGGITSSRANVERSNREPRLGCYPRPIRQREDKDNAK